MKYEKIDSSQINLSELPTSPPYLKHLELTIFSNFAYFRDFWKARIEWISIFGIFSRMLFGKLAFGILTFGKSDFRISGLG